jgi:hypothetical protein
MPQNGKNSNWIAYTDALTQCSSLSHCWVFCYRRIHGKSIYRGLLMTLLHCLVKCRLLVGRPARRFIFRLGPLNWKWKSMFLWSLSLYYSTNNAPIRHTILLPLALSACLILFSFRLTRRQKRFRNDVWVMFWKMEQKTGVFSFSLL